MADNKKALTDFKKELENDLYPENTPFEHNDIAELVSVGTKRTLKTATIDKINELMSADLVMRQAYRDNFVGFSSVLKNSNYSVEQYMNAVRYVTYKISGMPNIKAYMRTFPERYERLLTEGFDEQAISAYVSVYNGGKLVVALYEQARIPVYIANADILQEAINKQAEIMRTAKSEKVRSDAASCLIKELKAPENSKLQLEVNLKQDTNVMEMRESLRQLAITQQRLIESGAFSAGGIAASKLIEGTVIKDVE